MRIAPKIGITHLMHLCTMKFKSVPPRDPRTRYQWQSRINLFLEDHQFLYPTSWTCTQYRNVDRYRLYLLSHLTFHFLFSISYFLIAHICHNRHDQGWCTFSSCCTFCNEKAIFWPILVPFGQFWLFFAFFVYFLQALVVWWCKKIELCNGNSLSLSFQHTHVFVETSHLQLTICKNFAVANGNQVSSWSRRPVLVNGMVVQ